MNYTNIPLQNVNSSSNIGESTQRDFHKSSNYHHALKPKVIDFDESWDRLQHVILFLLKDPNKCSRTCFYESIENIYALCTALPEAHIDILYKSLYELLTNHVIELCQHIDAASDEDFIGVYAHKWHSYLEGSQLLNYLFTYMNRLTDTSLVNHDPDLVFDENIQLDVNHSIVRLPRMAVIDLCRERWHRIFFSMTDAIIPSIRERITSSLVRLINQSRQEQLPDSLKALFNYFKFINDLRQILPLPDDLDSIYHMCLQSLVDSKDTQNSTKYRMYKMIFNEPLVESTSSFYGELGERMAASLDCSTFMKQALIIQRTEMNRLTSLIKTGDTEIDKSTIDKIINTCRNCIVTKNRKHLDERVRDLVHGGIEQNSEDLHNMYIILREVNDGVDLLLTEFTKYGLQLGEMSVLNVIKQNSTTSSEQLAEDFTLTMLKTHAHLLALVQDVFESDARFTLAMDKAMSAIINYRYCTSNDKKQVLGPQPPRASEWIARYCDTVLRAAAKRDATASKTNDSGQSPGDSQEQQDECTQELLRKAITIFRFVDDKDIFQKYYQRMLTQRLIQAVMSSTNLSSILESEESTIELLRNVCGFEFTSKLQRMISDVSLSQEMSVNFRKIQISQPVFSALILCMAQWPLSPMQLQSRLKHEVKQDGEESMQTDRSADLYTMQGVPENLLDSISEFTTFYTSKYTGRRLQWLFNLGSVDIKLNYLDRPYTVTMKIYEYFVFSFLQDRDSCPLSEILGQTDLDRDLILKCIRALCDTQLITFDGDPASNDSSISLNLAFTSKRAKIKVLPRLGGMLGSQQQGTSHSSSANDMMMTSADDQVMTSSVEATVQQDRRHYIECVIVRLMKQKKQCAHNYLLTEVMKECNQRFQPDVTMIKTIVENLIDKGYISRDGGNDEYSYLA